MFSVRIETIIINLVCFLLIADSSMSIVTSADTGTNFRQLQQQSATLLQNALAPATRKAYTKAWDKYNTFATFFKKPNLLPLPIDNLCCFITYLHNQNTPTASITQIISGLSYLHKIRNLPDFTHSFPVRQLLSSLNKSTPCSRDNRLPITQPLLYEFLENIEKCDISRYKQLLFKAMFSMCFTFALRIGEITNSVHNIHLNQITMKENCLSLRFHSFKHSSNEPINKHEIATSGHTFCTVNIMKNYLSVRGKGAGPLFQYKNQPVSKSHFAAVLKTICKVCNIGHKRITPHSFRIGAANHWVNQGYSDHQIMRMGRWKSNAVFVYLRGTVHH